MINEETQQPMAASDAGQDAASGTQKKVIVYSTPTCHYCNLAKEYFNAKNISYTEYNVASDAEKRAEMMQKTGQMGVPVIEVGEEFVVGFNQAKIAEMLGIEE